MRILIASAYFAPELISIGRYNTEMACWLQRRGHEIRVVAMPAHYPGWKVMEGGSAAAWSRRTLDGVDVWRCPTFVPARPSGLKRLLWMTSFALSSLPVLLLQCFWRPEVVIVVEPPLLGAAPAMLCAAVCGSVTWLHVQDLEVDAAFDLGVLRGSAPRRVALWIERALMSRCDRVSTISQRMRERLIAKGILAERLFMLRNWVDPPAVEHGNGDEPADQPGYRELLGLGPNDRLALYAGNMAAKQGLMTLVNAAIALSHRRDIHFLLVGEGPALASLKEAARDVERVHFLPLQPSCRLAGLLRCADLHLLPQRAAAADLVMPSKLGGMLASGRPVVAGAAPDTEVAQVLQGRGLVVPPEDAAAFAGAILRLLDDPALSAELSIAGMAYACSELDREATLLRLEAELASVAHLRRKGHVASA